MPDSPFELNFESSDDGRGSVAGGRASVATFDSDNERPPPATAAPPVGWLRALPEYGVVLCTEHRSCYTPGANMNEHLKRKHHTARGETGAAIQDWVAGLHLPAEVTHPQDDTPHIPGLQYTNGWLCTAADETCSFRCGGKEQKMQRHCSQAHGVFSLRRQRERSMYRQVMLQWLFASAGDYWIVQGGRIRAQRLPRRPSIPGTPGASSGSVGGSPQTRTPHPTGSQAPTATATPSSRSSQQMLSTLKARLQNATAEDAARYRQLGEPNHVSEISPWLKIGGFHHHVAGLDAGLVASSHVAPAGDDGDPRLSELIWSVERVLLRAIPFQPLQKKSSFDNYIRVFQPLICYYVRVFEGHFGAGVEKFEVTEKQREALELALSVVEQVLEQVEAATAAELADEETTDDATERLEPELDLHVLTFCTALVEHEIKKSYDSALLSFLAMRSTIVDQEDSTITFRPEAQVSGRHDIYKFRQLPHIGEPLRQLCQEWVINTSRSPMSVMGEWRLYTMKVGGTFIPEALVVWDEDGKNLTYGDLRYGIQDLADEMGQALLEARRIFHTQLCLGFEGVPTFPLVELQDNWSNSTPGYSFVKEPRNATYLEEAETWLLEKISQDSEVLDRVFHTEQHEHDAAASWPVRSDFAKQYEVY